MNTIRDGFYRQKQSSVQTKTKWYVQTKTKWYVQTKTKWYVHTKTKWYVQTKTKSSVHLLVSKEVKEFLELFFDLFRTSEPVAVGG